MASNIKKEDLYFQSANGIDQIHILAYIPKGEFCGYVQIVHDMYEHIGLYDEILAMFARRGYLAFGHDHQGHGKSVSNVEELGKFPKNDSVINFIADTNRAFLYIFTKYPMKDLGTYKTFVAKKEGLFTKRVEVEKPIPPLHGLIGIGMGSTIVRNYTVMYDDMNCVVLMGDRGFQARDKRLLTKSQMLMNVYSEDGDASEFMVDVEKHYLSKIEANDRFDYRTSNEKERRIFKNDKLCQFEYDLKGANSIFKLLTMLDVTNWLDSAPMYLATYILGGESDPVNRQCRELKKVLSYAKRKGIKNLFHKYYEGYHNLFFEQVKTSVVRDIDTILLAVRNQQYRG